MTIDPHTVERWSERFGTSAGSAPTYSFRRQTSNYIGKIVHGASQLFSGASVSKRHQQHTLTTAVKDNIFASDDDHGQRDRASLTASETNFYKKWIVLGRAGSGGQFDVFFVISRKWYDSEAWRVVNGLNKGHRPDKPFHFDDEQARRLDTRYVSLTEGVRVAKVPVRLSQHAESARSPTDEVVCQGNDFFVLRQLGSESKYTPHLVDWDRVQDKPAWVVQDAYNCSTLYTFSKAWQAFHTPTTPLPESFIWHVFIDLALAMHYTHCAGIAHCDLVSFNICLHVPRKDFNTTRFPRVVPIDFGRARSGQLMEHHLCKWDMTRLGDLVHEMVHGIPFPTDGLHHRLRDPRTGHCSCINFAAGTGHSRLSRRGQTLYSEVMRYTAEASNKTIQDVLAKLVEHARIARVETYEPLPAGLLEVIVEKYFPTEETIWTRMQQQRKG